MDPMKVCRVTEWPTPMKVKEVQSFLGFVNFYQKFICNFSNIACPLYTLTRKTQWWVWGSPEQEAFNALKKAVTSAPILTFPTQSGCFHLECNVQLCDWSSTLPGTSRWHAPANHLHVKGIL